MSFPASEVRPDSDKAAASEKTGSDTGSDVSSPIAAKIDLETIQPNGETEDTGPQMITVWHFGGRSDRAGNRKSVPVKGKQARGKNRSDRSQQEGLRKKSKPQRGPDPDSPFAALAGLKKQLDSGDGKN